MGQSMSFGSRDGFSDSDHSIESSSVMTSETSVQMSSVNNGGGLDLDNKFFVCSLIKEDPNGYSSRVYYRSDPGRGVPFKWEAEPGKPKKSSTNGESDFSLPLSPPPSFEAKQKSHKKSKQNSSKRNKTAKGCAPFSIKSVWSSIVPYSNNNW